MMTCFFISEKKEEMQQKHKTIVEGHKHIHVRMHVHIQPNTNTHILLHTHIHLQIHIKLICAVLRMSK